MSLSSSNHRLLHRALPALLVAATATVAASSPQNPVTPENGTLGFQPPEVTDVRLHDTVPHQDQTGGAVQSLIALTGCTGGGFAAVWRDNRDGVLGLYLGRFDARGQVSEPEQPLYHMTGTARRTDPVVVLRPDGSGAVVWISASALGQVPWIRCFDAHGVFAGEERMAPPTAKIDNNGPAAGPGGRSGRGAAQDPNSRAPALAELSDGYALAWTRGGDVELALFGLDGNPRGATTDVTPANSQAEPGVALVVGASGDLAIAWRSKEGTFASVHGAHGFTREALGAGTLHEIVRDPQGGFVALFAVGDKPVLRHLAEDGKPDRPDADLGLGALAGMQMATFEGGFALVAESGAGASGEAGKPTRGERADRAREQQKTERGFTLHLFDDHGQPRAGSPLTVPSDGARGMTSPRVASNRHTLFVAWTDARNGDTDVYGRGVDPAATEADRLGPEVRINTDHASSDQINPMVAASGDHGVIVWADKRNVLAHVYARRFTKKGFDGDEMLLPVAMPNASPGPATSEDGAGGGPGAAVRATGEFLVCWRLARENGGVIRAQIFHADGTPRSTAIDVDAPGKEDDPSSPFAVALRAERGYVMVWSRGRRGGVWLRRLAPDGAMSSPARHLNENSDLDAEYPKVALLDDGRLLAAWDVHDATKWSLRARFLDESGETRGGEMTFEHARFDSSWDPSIAPAENGGFALAWCSGSPSEPTRDVCCRLFDNQGKPKGPILTPCWLANEQDWHDITRLADKSFAVAWEDDVSYYDQAYVRRMMPNGREMGPMMRLNETETKLVPDRVAPRVAALSDGLAATFGDRRRSLGMDVILKIVGPRWDAVPKK